MEQKANVNFFVGLWRLLAGRRLLMGASVFSGLVFAATTLILGAAYTLWMIKRVVFGEVANSHVAALTDVGAREFWMLMVLAIAVLIVGVWPGPLVEVMDASIGQLLIHVGQPKL